MPGRVRPTGCSLELAEIRCGWKESVLSWWKHSLVIRHRMNYWYWVRAALLVVLLIGTVVMVLQAAHSMLPDDFGRLPAN
jgi:hypothetical protein